MAWDEFSDEAMELQGQVTDRFVDQRKRPSRDEGKASGLSCIQRGKRVRVHRAGYWKWLFVKIEIGFFGCEG